MVTFNPNHSRILWFYECNIIYKKQELYLFIGKQELLTNHWLNYLSKHICDSTYSYSVIVVIVTVHIYWKKTSANTLGSYERLTSICKKNSFEIHFSNFIGVPGLSKGSDVFMASSFGQSAGIVIVCWGPVLVLFPVMRSIRDLVKRQEFLTVLRKDTQGKKPKILCFLLIVLAFLIQRERVRMLTRTSYLQLIFYVLGQENSQVLYLLEHVRRKKMCLL